jgi:hypothetical protein
MVLPADKTTAILRRLVIAAVTEAVVKSQVMKTGVV